MMKCCCMLLSLITVMYSCLYIHMVLGAIVSVDQVADSSWITHHNVISNTIIKQLTMGVSKSGQMDRETDLEPDWMSKSISSLSSKHLGDVVIPGTHSSASYSIGWTGDDRVQIVDESLLLPLAVTLGMQHFVSRWARTQDADLFSQLKAGYRYLDLRVASEGNGNFLWHNAGLTGQHINQGLMHIHNFASMHRQEIIIISFRDFWQVQGIRPRQSMELKDKQQLAALIYEILHNDLVPTTVGNNPNISSVLDTGRNIVALFQLEPYFSQAYPQWFWNDVNNKTTYEIRAAFHNPVEVFTFSDSILKLYKHVHSNNVTVIRPVICPSLLAHLSALLLTLPCQLILATSSALGGYLLGKTLFTKMKQSVSCCKLLKRRKRVVFILSTCMFVTVITTNVLLRFALSCLHFDGFAASFQEMAQMANKHGLTKVKALSKRNGETFVQNRGINDMIYFWLSRPDTHKLNVILVDDFRSSTIVQHAISTNTGLMTRKMSMTFIGSPLTGGSSVRVWFSCPQVQVSYLIVSRDEGKAITWSSIYQGDTITFEEGQFPMDSYVIICVGSIYGKWYQLYTGNLQQWIDTNLDLYIRGSETRSGHGLAYISSTFLDAESHCIPHIPKTVLNSTMWNDSTVPLSKLKHRHPQFAP